MTLGLGLFIAFVVVALGVGAWALVRYTSVTLNTVVKVAPIIGGVLAGIWAIVQYNDSAQSEMKKADATAKLEIDRADRAMKNEIERTYNEKRLAICIEASDVAALLSTRAAGAPASDEWLRARTRFETLYWGSLAIFEDSDVSAKYVEFRKDLVNVEKSGGDLAKLQGDALGVSRACRSLISGIWKLNLEEIRNK